MDHQCDELYMLYDSDEEAGDGPRNVKPDVDVTHEDVSHRDRGPNGDRNPDEQVWLFGRYFWNDLVPRLPQLPKDATTRSSQDGPVRVIVSPSLTKEFAKPGKQEHIEGTQICVSSADQLKVLRQCRFCRRMFIAERKFDAKEIPMAFIGELVTVPIPMELVSFAPKINDVQGLEFYTKTYHAVCSGCSPHVHRAVALCSFCSHLRIDHVISCVASNATESVRIIMGRFADIERRRGSCNFCHFVTKFVEHNLDGGNSPKTLHIQILPRRPDREGTLAMLRLLTYQSRGDAEVRLERTFGMLAAWRWQDSLWQTLDPVTGVIGIDWCRIRGWLNECSENHKSSCSTPKHSLFNFPDFRVVDVERQCVVRASEGCQYVAMSYVWGTAKDAFAATTKNVEQLSKPGAMLTVPIPLSLRDAITVCSKLSHRYLWIDRICILQDDTDTKMKQIRVMDNVYRHAELTIVALAGKDAEHGLPGVSTTLRRQIMQCRLGDIMITQYSPVFRDEKNRSKWSTRGWTYQEEVLSSRLLYFSDDQIALWCRRSTTKQERPDYLSETHDSSKNSMSLVPSYKDAMESYRSRDLSNASDILRAFSGYLHDLFGNDHLFGIPLRHFDIAMEWDVEGDQVLRPPSPPDVFPTWSWISVLGEEPVEFAKELQYVASIASWAMCSRDSADEVSLSWINSSSREIDENNDTSLVSALVAWCEGCFPIPAPIESYSEYSWAQLEDFTKQRWSSYKEFWEESHGLKQSKFDPAVDTQANSFASLIPGRLLVRSQALQALIFPGRKHEGNVHRCVILTVCTSELRMIGEASLGVSQLDRLCPDRAPDMVFHILLFALSIGLDTSRVMEFERAGTTRLDELENAHNPNWRPKVDEEHAYYDSEGEIFGQAVPPLPKDHQASTIKLKVMLVKQRRDGDAWVGQRIGLGWVWLKSWSTSSTRFESLALE